jgi:hypothetical protein
VLPGFVWIVMDGKRALARAGTLCEKASNKFVAELSKKPIK